MKRYLIFAAWTLLAGAGIPLIGVLNSGMARSVGNPFAAHMGDVRNSDDGRPWHHFAPLRTPHGRSTRIISPDKLGRRIAHWLLCAFCDGHNSGLRRGELCGVYFDRSAPYVRHCGSVRPVRHGKAATGYGETCRLGGNHRRYRHYGNREPAKRKQLKRPLLDRAVLAGLQSRPDRSDELVLRNRRAGIFDEVTQDCKGLWPNCNLVPFKQKASAIQVPAFQCPHWVISGH